MNIDGLGSETIELLFNENLINNIADIYDLKKEQVEVIGTHGRKICR